MKEFDLDKALNGEPVVLRNGCKAIVYYKVPNEYNFLIISQHYAH